VTRLRPVLDLIALAIVIGFAIFFAGHPLRPLSDDLGYWQTRTGGPLYSVAWNTAPNAFIYSPAFAQVIRPFTMLPFAWFHALLVFAQVGALVWLVGPVASVAYLASPLGRLDVEAGNVYVLLAAAVAASAWPAILLTKVTPGIGLVWYAVRREWQALAVAIGLTTAIVLVSALIWPSAWIDWITALSRAPGSPQKGIPVPLLVRLPIALGIVAWGAQRGSKWTVAVGAAVASPNLGPSSLTFLLAIPRLQRSLRPQHGGAEPVAAMSA
jgi:hypothetical protein